MKKKIAYLLGSALLALSVTGCGGGKEAASTGDGSTPAPAADGGGKPQTLVVVDWGGAVTEARKKPYFEPFEKANNVKIVVESPTDYGKFKAMVQSGNVTWDVVNVDTFFVYQAAEEGLLEPLDYNVIDKTDIMTELAHEYGIGAELYTNTIAYNITKYPNGTHPKSWADFFDTEKFPGPRAFYKFPGALLEAALLADGVPKEELYPLDVDRAFKKLDQIKPHMKVWWTAGAQPPQLLASGDVVMSNAWNGRITTAKAQGVPVDQEYNQGILSSESWVVPKGTKNKELAMKFLAFISSAEAQAAFASEIDYTPVNKKAIEMLPAEVRVRLGQTPEKSQTQVLTNDQWWAENFETVNQRFEEWLLK